MIAVTLHLVLDQELEMLSILAALDVQVPRDESVVELIELIDEGTLDVDRRLRKKLLRGLLANWDSSELTTMVGLALDIRRVYSRVGALEGG